ncbi:MAG: hypothetical protein KJ623_02600 [Nanoarchaeota archaeon]|nr:hypothetical protein [Nanoarchaeota archaeon]
MKNIIILLSILLVSAACTIPGQQSGQSQNNIIDINFLTSQPPTELYDGQTFRVGLNLKNYDTSNKEIIVCVYDTLGDFFDGIPAQDCRSVKLAAAETSNENILPSDKKVYFPDESDFYSYTRITGNMQTTVFADVYYNHVTKADAQICIKRDIETETPIKCDASSTETINNNDAPVKIKNLEKTIVPIGNNKINLMLKFDISNVGGGKLINKNAINSRENIEPTIGISVNLLGITKDFKCNPISSNGRITLEGNQKTIKCQATIDMKQDYIINPVQITLDYGYTNNILTSAIQLTSEGGK